VTIFTLRHVEDGRAEEKYRQINVLPLSTQKKKTVSADMGWPSTEEKRKRGARGRLCMIERTCRSA